MKLTMNKLIAGLTILSALLLCYFSFAGASNLFLYYFLFHTALLTYHLLFDKEKNHLFIWVMSFFLASSGFGLYFTYFPLQNPLGSYYYLGTIQLCLMIGFVLIFIQLIKDTFFNFKFSLWSILIVGILLLNYYFATKIIEMVEVYKLSSEHIIYSFAYTIVKMLMMSIGLIIYLTNSMKYQNAILLIGAFTCFFLSDIALTINALVFFETPMQALNILGSGFYCIALALFYVYIVSPKTLNLLLYTKVMEEEDFKEDSNN